ncbi:AcrR family transcriptional regulator [Streptacidiphilus sp. MAP12-33]|uniref:TetR/AcrR family transcriptional regulator n=1 Tax=Streptacidiphilus sp. MAP12-33 TaxID=3156266 RepID=UPI003511265E
MTDGRRIRGMDAEQRKALRRRQLLDSALELFASQGYAATPIEQLCQHAFVGTKGFYETFDSREACYLALLGEITERTEARMDACLAEDADETVLVDAFADALVGDPRVAQVAFGHGMAVSPALERARRENRRWAAGFVLRVWDAGGVTPAPGVDPRVAARGLIGGMFDLIADWLVESASSDTAPLREALACFYRVVRAGVGRPQ